MPARKTFVGKKLAKNRKEKIEKKLDRTNEEIQKTFISSEGHMIE